MTIYEVDILPAAVPAIFRSGMTANVEIVREIKRNVLTLPLEAVELSREGNFVLSAGEGNRPPRRIPVQTGITAGGRVEIVSGLDPEARVLVASRRRAGAGDRAGGQNPFMPNRRR